MKADDCELKSIDDCVKKFLWLCSTTNGLPSYFSGVEGYNSKKAGKETKEKVTRLYNDFDLEKQTKYSQKFEKCIRICDKLISGKRSPFGFGFVFEWMK